MPFVKQAKQRHVRSGLLRSLGRRTQHLSATCVVACVCAALVLPREAVAVRTDLPPRPVTRVPLDGLGFPGYGVSFLHQGASMATVHILDESHVLFTYSLRSLVPRLPGDEASDSDRQVAAVMVEVPSGKVLARTVWRLHDHGRYLWQVGPGVFMLRSGSTLALLAPLQELAAGHDPFLRLALPHRQGLPVLVEGSPDGKMITLELANELPAAEGDDEAEMHRRKHYTLEFYRLIPGPASTPLSITSAGAIRSPVPLHLAMDGDGYLWAEDGQRGRWTLSFNEFGGKQEKLAPVVSSCHPRLNLLSRSQFLVETCRGTDEQPMLASFGFDGHENWEEPFGEALQPPTLALAPQAGRFAMSRLVASSGGAPISGMAEGDPISQEIRVYQTESGDLLFKLQCAPAIRSAENFDLSSDGRTLVVLAAQTLDVYRLPALTDKDRKELAEAQTMTPPPGSGPVALTRITRPLSEQETVAEAETVQRPAEPAVSRLGKGEGSSLPTTATAPPAPKKPDDEGNQRPALSEKGTQEAAGSEAGNTSTEPKRKPPTLLNPGEHSEYTGQKATPPPADPQ